MVGGITGQTIDCGEYLRHFRDNQGRLHRAEVKRILRPLDITGNKTKCHRYLLEEVCPKTKEGLRVWTLLLAELPEEKDDNFTTVLFDNVATAILKVISKDRNVSEAEVLFYEE